MPSHSHLLNSNSSAYRMFSSGVLTSCCSKNPAIILPQSKKEISRREQRGIPQLDAILSKSNYVVGLGHQPASVLHLQDLHITRTFNAREVERYI